MPMLMRGHSWISSTRICMAWHWERAIAPRAIRAASSARDRGLRSHRTSVAARCGGTRRVLRIDRGPAPRSAGTRPRRRCDGGDSPSPRPDVPRSRATRLRVSVNRKRQADRVARDFRVVGERYVYVHALEVRVSVRAAIGDPFTSAVHRGLPMRQPVIEAMQFEVSRSPAVDPSMACPHADAADVATVLPDLAEESCIQCPALLPLP